MSNCQADIAVYPLAADLFIAMEAKYQVTVYTIIPSAEPTTGLVRTLTDSVVEIQTMEGTSTILLKFIGQVDTMVRVGGYAS